MRIPGSNPSLLYIGSDDEDDDNNTEVNENGAPTGRGHRHTNAGSRTSSVGSFTNPTWPQSYRQSMDYQIVSGSPTFQIFSPIPRISSSFLSSSFKKQDSAFFSSSENLRIPFLPGKGEDAEQGLGGAKPICKVDSDASITYLPSKFADAEREEEGSSFTQAMLNGLNVLAGVGVLSTPYALKEGGFLGIILLFALAAICCYTGILLRRCLDSQPGMQSYPDIGQAAFGTTGRFIISIILYIELYACCVEFIILEGDNLSALFPGARLDMGGLHLDSQHVFCIVSALVIMPTVWLRDLSVLSYVSAGGVVATLVVVFSVFWVGAFDGVGFHRGTGPLLNIAQLPVSIGLYGFCYSGHAVFPNVYTSMKRPQDFNLVLQVSFFIVSLIYGGMAVMGISMFGQDTLSSITLNLPKEFLASKIAVWTTVINPITKFALTMTPVALCLEELLPYEKAMKYSTFLRTGLVMSTAAVAVLVPYFGLVMAFIGAFLSMTVSLILPCLCYLSIVGDKTTIMQRIVCVFIIVVGVVCVIAGTYSSVAGIIQSVFDT
ncbi:solute carrier family 32 (vesicular inhibitory amino acid transporter) [Marchantia polymorpha subsp. ruderalis]|nr:hypothetical protein MARPO_0026s0021 [Marchantia polymorpha]BBN02195.1 hypothetical protein Mp_2g13500 [Marchantia polymorpha subsp. ruderalis]|eukprot:PTQ43123.1 hypothetical protein MARPO_0026s0021 [Marchantia polymorpha]